MKKTILTKNAPQPIGPYSQAVSTGNLLFISGQIPLKADATLAGADIESQTRQSLENIKAILAEAGLTLDNVVKTTVLMKDLGEFGRMNAVYGEYFTSNPPARAAYQVVKLPLDVLVEIEAVAVID
jgi:2-iminobutanoate/2-iminopropanoate deaminase